MAYCEAFPRGANASAGAGGAQPPTVHYAQVGPQAVPRSNFDSIGWALLTVFQILTLEDWNGAVAQRVHAGRVGCAAACARGQRRAKRAR